MNFLITCLVCIGAMFSHRQGVEGFLREVKGNQMGVEKTAGNKGHPLVGKIYIFKQLKNTDLVGLEGQWCKSVQQKPYLIIQTDNKGYFKQALKKGTYVVLAEAYDGFFIPSLDQYNQPSKVFIVSQQYTPLNILVNSKAIY
jgi:hypothetical protein